MATEMRIWRVSDNNTLESVQDGAFETKHLEKELESWIESNPSILGEDLLVVARQLSIPGIGILDLLCIDSVGVPVIVELKRSSTPREAIAQALDYASWLDTLSGEQFREVSEQYLNKSLADAFSDHFAGELPEDLDCQNHRIILVAPKLDAAAERIINYLSERYSMGVNAVFFKYAQVGSEEILARSILVPDEVIRVRRSSKISKARPEPDELCRMAEERNVTEMVDACRDMNTVWNEQNSAKHGGSWAYSLTTPFGWRQLFRIDVAGGGLKTPNGELDLWIRYKNVAEVTQTEDTLLRRTLEVGHVIQAEKSGNLIVRLKTKEEAEKLIQQFKEWCGGANGHEDIESEITNVDLH